MRFWRGIPLCVAVLDAYVAVVSRINKDLGDKLKKVVDKFKGLLDKLAQAIVDTINVILDTVAQAVKQLVDTVTRAIQKFVDALVSTLQKIWEIFKACVNACIESIGAILQKMADIFLVIFKKACAFAGADPEPMIAAAKNIVNDPIGFFKTLWSGIKQGFGQFKANIAENA